MSINKMQLNYLNVGCGNKLHIDWINLDINSSHSGVVHHDLLKGLPFPDEKMEVLYHSQVLEHLSKEKAFDFMKDCYRVLKTGGVIRVVVPDLESIVDEYKKWLDVVSTKNSNKEAEANYDWIMLELYDQVVRNHSGGEMAKFLQQPKMLNEQYVVGRMGRSGLLVRNNILLGNKMQRDLEFLGVIGFIKKTFKYVLRKIMDFVFGEKYRVGNFRLGGDVHLWMYDRFSLCRLLTSVGFKDIKIKNAFESDIPNWSFYELDVKNGMVYDPASLFVEAKK